MTSPFDALKHLTRARIALGRAGDGLPTGALLDFTLAHALARDAIHGEVDWAALQTALAPLETVTISSAATDKQTYLRRPDLGRILADGEAAKLPQGPFDIAIVIGDGLSADACMAHAAETAHEIVKLLADFSCAPIVLAKGARVALSDPIGAALNADLVIMLIGERPGLTTADSLGAYLTFAPRTGRQDSERNCISNIHAHGLSPTLAAQKIAWLAREALRLRLTGVELKEAAPDGLLPEPIKNAALPKD
jgi:ethanolamine ammonia-lyase small subunit